MVQTHSFNNDDNVFDQFPGYVSGVVLAYDVTNRPSPAELAALLRLAEEEVRRTVDAAGAAEHPRTRSWRAAFRATGAEVFTALDGVAVEHPVPGETIVAEGERVLTRRGVWRQGTAPPWSCPARPRRSSMWTVFHPDRWPRSKTPAGRSQRWTSASAVAARGGMCHGPGSHR